MRVRQDGASRRFAAVSWAAVVLWAGLVFFMSSNTGEGLHSGLGLVSSVYDWLDALQRRALRADVDVVSPCAHFCEYAVLGALLCNALRCHLPLGWAVVGAACACASAYGATDEFHQLFVEGRMCDAADWAVDTVGALVGALAARAALAQRG